MILVEFYLLLPRGFLMVEYLLGTEINTFSICIYNRLLLNIL